MLDLVILFLAVSTVGMLAVSAWSYYQSRCQPVRRIRAIVMGRRTRSYGIDIPTNPIPYFINALGAASSRFGSRRSNRISNKSMARLTGEATIAEHVEYLVRFGVDGSELEFSVPHDVFMTAEDGKVGTLVYQGEIFKYFIPETDQSSHAYI